MKVVIGKPYIEERDGDIVRICSNIMSPSRNFTLWYEVDKTYGKYFSIENCDAFLVPLLPWLMINSKQNNIKDVVCEEKVTDRLLGQIKNYFIPILVANIDCYYDYINIHAETTTSKENAKAVGFGISGGIDSSYTLAKYLKSDISTMKLTHSVFFDNGLYGSDADDFLKSFVEKISISQGLEFLKIKTNTFLELYSGGQREIVPFCFLGGILSLQKLFRTYHYSSDFAANQFQIDGDHAATYDLLTVHLFSTDSTTFYSSGIEATRLEKMNYIADFDFTYDNISVCLFPKRNKQSCGKCAKCSDAMAGFDSIGKLELYKNSFDIKDFRKNFAYHLGYVRLKSMESVHIHSAEILQQYKNAGKKMPMKVYLSALKKYISRGFTSINKKRIKINEVCKL